MANPISPRLPFEPADDELQALDFSLILELVPAAALSYNRSNDSIISVNQKLLELTSFELASLLGKSLTTLVTLKLDTNPTGRDARLVHLKTAGGSKIQASLRIQSLSQTNQIVALVFSPPDSQVEPESHAASLAFIEALLRIQHQDTSTAALSAAAEILHKSLRAQAAAVYIQRKGEKELIRVRLDTDLQSAQFPDLYTPPEPLTADIITWKSSQKPSSTLEELALVKGFHYLLVIPLSRQKEFLGALTAAGFGSQPDEDSLRRIKLIASSTAGVLHHLARVENAQRAVQRTRQVVQLEHAISDNIEEGLIILTPDLSVAEMNPSAEMMLGYASSEVFLQKADMVLIGNETLSTLYKSAQQGISTKVANNLSLNTRTGKSFLAQVVCIPVMTDGKLSSILLILRDLSQSEQIRAHTQQLEQRAFLGEVSAIFAHEVKNPINSIMTGLQYIGMTMKPGDPHYDLVSRLQNDCLRLTHLMDSTLTFSKPVEYHFRPVDLAEMLPSILERWAPRLTRLNIRYNFDANPAHPLVRADARALEQVFVNLVSNAVQAMEKTGGTLNLRVINGAEHLVPAQYEIIVADSGPGIPDDIKDHIFEPFVTTNVSGTGLGLAITKRIVTAHKGTINLESYPGGTMFHVFLPKAE
ncbi:MAG TPA: ATP-binding protein [Anaerolineaceae bacterium]|nr:PAS domain-containing protein [Anaerolineaceae bacterium]NMD27103.1 PAS domain-containing protein [Chloroflexota bacterium]HOA21680.1 ATP-binding protein [Anaerolineaceae bacterium]